MFNEDLVNALYQKLLKETDPQKIRDLTHALRAIVETNVEDLRLRMDFLMRHYSDVFEEDQP